jgi:hypothetical protein
MAQIAIASRTLSGPERPRPGPNIMAGEHALRPLVGFDDEVWFSTDTKRMFFGTGSGWTEFAGGGGSGGSPMDTVTTLDEGAGSAGVLLEYSRGDHKHPVTFPPSGPSGGAFTQSGFASVTTGAFTVTVSGSFPAPPYGVAWSTNWPTWGGWSGQTSGQFVLTFGVEAPASAQVWWGVV